MKPGLYLTAQREMERELLPSVMHECGWNSCEAAERLGLNRATLRKKLKALGIKIPESETRVYRVRPGARVPAVRIKRVPIVDFRNINPRWDPEIERGL